MQKGYLLLLIATIPMALGQYFMKLGANSLHTTAIYLNFTLFLGLILYISVFGLIFLAFKTKELSKGYPILALTYLWVNLIAVFLLNEQISILSWIGTTLIIGGILLITKK
jgi:drug/metabolite transporter (DMT)-like permease